MSLTIYRDLEQGSDEWLQARCGILTASVIGKLLTATGKVANNDTSRGLLETLLAERITGRVEYVHPNRDMQRGTLLEPYARDLYAEHHAPVEEVGFMVWENRDITLGYSPDGIVGDDGLLEIKSRNPRAQTRTVITDRVPAANMAQLQAGLLVSDRQWIDYVSYCPGLPLYVKRIQPIPEMQAALIEAAVRAEEMIRDQEIEWQASSKGLHPTEYFDPFEEEEIAFG